MIRSILDKMKTTRTPENRKLTVTVDEAAKSLGVSRTTIYRLIAAGHLRAPHALRRKLIPTGELHRFLNRHQ